MQLSLSQTVAAIFKTQKIFDLLLKVFLWKRNKIATEGRTWTSNPDLSYPNLSLPNHYTTTLTHQNSEKK